MIKTHLLQVTDLKHIKVRPILLRKGGVKLAIYGLSHVKDERLHRLLRENKVIFTRNLKPHILYHTEEVTDLCLFRSPEKIKFEG